MTTDEVADSLRVDITSLKEDIIILEKKNKELETEYIEYQREVSRTIETGIKRLKKCVEEIYDIIKSFDKIW